MKYAWGAFWGIVITGNLFIVLLFLSMLAENYSVFLWLYTTKYAVLYIAGMGVMLGVSFAYSNRNEKIYKLNKSPRRVSAGRILTSRVSALLAPVKTSREG